MDLRVAIESLAVYNCLLSWTEENQHLSVQDVSIRTGIPAFRVRSVCAYGESLGFATSLEDEVFALRPLAESLRSTNARWAQLSEALRGNPLVDKSAPSAAEEKYQKSVLDMKDRFSDTAAQVGRFVSDFVGYSETRRIIDIAAGAGTWGLGLVEACGGVLTCIDLPAVAHVGSSSMDASQSLSAGHSPVNWIGADVLASVPDIRRADFCVLGNVLHLFGDADADAFLLAADRLLDRAGLLVIIDSVADSDEIRRFESLSRFGTQVAARTAGGGIRSRAELTCLLASSGMSVIADSGLLVDPNGRHVPVRAILCRRSEEL